MDQEFKIRRGEKGKDQSSNLLWTMKQKNAFDWAAGQGSLFQQEKGLYGEVILFQKIRIRDPVGLASRPTAYMQAENLSQTNLTTDE